jgi:hypothetical protein
MTCLLYWLTGFRGEDFKTFFPIGSYVKTISADGSHLGWRSGSLDIILKVDYLRTILRTIHAMLALNVSDTGSPEPLVSLCFEILT